MNATDELRRAFETADAATGGRNFVKLLAVRQAAAMPRAEFDATLRQLRMAGVFTLNSHEGGYSSRLTTDERSAGIQEGGSLLVWIARKGLV